MTMMIWISGEMYVIALDIVNCAITVAGKTAELNVRV